MDPRRTSHQQRTAPLSPLMKAKSQGGKNGEVVNACPFGCADHNLDHNGYCYHLVGFIDQADAKKPKAMMEPMRLIGGQRVTRGGKSKEPLKKGDRLVKATTCYRVYRDVEMPPEELAYIEHVSGERTEEGPLPDEFTVGSRELIGSEERDEDDEDYTDSELEDETAPASATGKK